MTNAFINSDVSLRPLSGTDHTKVASFSFCGPSFTDHNILKPDIISPCVSILAACPFPVDLSTATAGDFNIESGTSMACPHLSAITALVKAAHPRCSPAMIKAAIMTTASTAVADVSPILDQNHNSADLSAVGAGHVNPARAEGEKKSYTVTFSPAANSGSPPAAFTAGCIKRVSNLISVTFSTGT